MPFWRREPTLAEALQVIREQLRAGTLPDDIVKELEQRGRPVIAGPPGLQELLDGIPSPAALLEVGGRIVARNKAATELMGLAPVIGDVSAELGELCARALAGWPHKRELPLG